MQADIRSPAASRQLRSGSLALDALLRFRQIRSLLRLTSFDTSTAEGLSKERYRRIAMTTFASILSKGVALLTALVTVPFTINYLGAERFGLWMTISSLVAMLGFADFGVGNSLLTAVSEAKGKEDEEMARRCISSGFFMLTGVALVVIAAFVLVDPFIPVQRLFSIKSTVAIREA